MLCSFNRIYKHYDTKLSRMMIHKYDNIIFISDPQFECICKEAMNQMNLVLNQRVHYYEIGDIQYLNLDDMDDHKTIWFMIETNVDTKYISCLNHVVFINKHNIIVSNYSKQDILLTLNDIQHISSILNHYYLIALFESICNHLILSSKNEG